MNIFNNPLLNIASQAALAAATGGSSLAIQAAVKAVVVQVAQQAIGALGQQLGLPPAMVTAAQTALAGEMGMNGTGVANGRSELMQMAAEKGMSPLAMAGLDRLMDEMGGTMDDLVANILDGINQESAERIKRGDKGRGGRGGEGSILMQIAVILGGVLDDKMQELKGAAEALGDLGDNKSLQQTQKSGGFLGFGGKKNTSWTPKGQAEFGEQSAKVQALGQQVGYIANAMSTAIKSSGEGISTAARK